MPLNRAQKPVSARRKPSVRRVGLLGDSRCFLSHSGSNGNDFVKGYGIAHWIQVYSGGACVVPVGMNFGVAGDTTRQILARIATAVAAFKAGGVDLVVVMAGTNDRTGGNLQLGQTKRNLREIVRILREAGIDPVVVAETPRGNGSSSYELSTQALKDDHFACHRWIRDELSKDCAVADVWDEWIDPASGTNYYPLAKFVRDWIHPTKIGAQSLGRAIGRIVAEFVRALPDLLESPVQFSAAEPLGSLSPNPTMTGTTGSIAGNCNPTAGSVLATGWGAEASNMAGITTTWKKETDADNVEWQRLDIKGTAGASAPEITAYAPVTLASLSDADKLKATGLVRSQGAGLSAVGLALLMVPSFTQKLDGEDSDNSLPWPPEPLGPHTRETPVLQFLTSANHSLIRVRLIVTTQPGKAVDATVWFTKPGAFKVA